MQKTSFSFSILNWSKAQLTLDVVIFRSDFPCRLFCINMMNERLFKLSMLLAKTKGKIIVKVGENSSWGNLIYIIFIYVAMLEYESEALVQVN